VKEFNENYISTLKSHLISLNDDDFVFTNSNGVPLHSEIFSKMMFNWTGEHFYPHIIRSHYADLTCLDFLKHKKRATKEEVESKFLEVAKNLGHKKYNKKTDTWEPNFKVTLVNYIHPTYSQKMIALYEK